MRRGRWSLERKSDPKTLFGHIYALFSVIVWGSCYVLTKNMLNAGFTALQITPVRMALAYVVLLLMRPKFQKLPWKDELIFVLIGLFGGSVYFFLQNTALRPALEALDERVYGLRLIAGWLELGDKLE